MDDDRFREEQRAVARGMASAAILAVVVVAAAVLTADAWLPELTTSADRMAWAGRWQLLALLWLAAGIADVARRRFFSPSHIAGASSDVAGAADAVHRAKAVLQNSLEQVVLATGAQMIFAASVQGAAAAAIPACACLFFAGRGFFWLGYARGARSRALGFGLSFYPSVSLLIASAGLLLIV